MMHDHVTHTHEHSHCCVKWLSWTAVIVGALVGLGLSFLLNLFNIAIGLSVFTTNPDGMMTLAIGGFVGLLIGAIVSMFVAGYTAGYLGRPFRGPYNLGVIYGFTTWCLMLVFAMLLTTHMGRYMASYSNNIARPSAVIVMTDNNMPGNNTAMNASAPVAAAAKASSASKTVKPATANSPQVVTVDVEKATNQLGMGAFVIFVLFFVGALSACFGGYCGASCCREDRVVR